MMRLIIILTAAMMCATLASGCVGNDSIPSVTATEFNTDIKSGTMQLLDVRTPKEYAEGHISGAVNIDVKSDDFQKRSEKELSKDSTVLVYCRSGRRSLEAAEALTRLGYKVINLDGGIIEWKDKGFPVVK